MTKRYRFAGPVIRRLFCFIIVLICLIPSRVFGQSRAEIFAPGVISLPDRIEFCSALSPDGQAFFFTVRRSAGHWELHQARKLNGMWQTSSLLPFSGQYSDSEPSLSPDGQRLFFSSNRPVPGQTDPSDYNIWMVDRQNGFWLEPQVLPSPINGPGDQWRASQSRQGTLYYSSMGLWSCAFNGRSAGPVFKLFDPQNPGQIIGGHAFISPDESTLLTAWMNGPGGQGGWDLYICFRDDQGNWRASVNLGKQVNSPAEEDFPSLSPDGRTLFFFRYQKKEGRETGDIYSIDTACLKEFRK